MLILLLAGYAGAMTDQARRWRRAHWWVGTATLVLFLASGAYMRWLRAPPVRDLSDVERAVYRSRHLFLLLAALVNLAMSTALAETTGKTRRTAGALALAAPVLLVAAFLVEPQRGIQETIFAGPALYLLSLATVLLVILGWRRGA